MSGQFKTMLDAIEKEVFSPDKQTLWERARKKHPVLNKYQTARSLIEEISHTKTGVYRYRDILTRALIAQYKIHRDPFWISLLMVLYGPMLMKLRGRIQSTAMLPEDVDQLVISSFMEAIDHLSFRAHWRRTSMYLRTATKKKVFGILGKRQNQFALTEAFEERTSISHGEAFDPFQRLTDPHTLSIDELVAWIQTSMREDLSQDVIDLVLLPHIEEPILAKHLRRLLPDCDEEQLAREYQRVKRQKNRAEHAIREKLGHFLCPQNEEERTFSK